MRTLQILWFSVALAACSNAPQLCSACPPIEGHWALKYQPYDGGTDLGPDCASVPPPAGPMAIDIVRNGALLHASLNGIDSQGQFVDSQDFTIAGTTSIGGDADNVQQVSLRGYFLAGDTPDAGATLQAKWITHTEQGTKACDAEQRCVGTR